MRELERIVTVVNTSDKKFGFMKGVRCTNALHHLVSSLEKEVISKDSEANMRICNLNIC